MSGPSPLLPMLAALLLVTSGACGRDREPIEDAAAVRRGTAAVPERASAGAARAPGYCRTQTAIELGPEIALTPDPGMGSASPIWEGDLNGDGLGDLVLRFAEGCGNYGDCPYGIYVACGAGSGAIGGLLYGSVWGPAYSFDLGVDEGHPSSETGWLTLLDTQREGEEISVRRLGFTGDRFAIVEILDR